MSKKAKHIIFDLDGTIIDSKAEIISTYLHVFNEIRPGKVVDPSQLNFGATLNDVMAQVYGTDVTKIEKAKRSFILKYDFSEYPDTHLYDGVLETLQWMKTKDYHLYIATNKRLVPTMRILEKKNIAHYFSDVIANEMRPMVTLSKSEMISTLKRNHGFSTGFMVGDSASDIQAGNSENLITIAVTYGYENRDIFAALNPISTIDSFREIINIVQNQKA